MRGEARASRERVQRVLRVATWKKEIKKKKKKGGQ